LLGDFELAEEAPQDAWIAALDQWPRDGVPANPRAGLIRFRISTATGCSNEINSGM
jgi:predicted RNA polymerase sigma factor